MLGHNVRVIKQGDTNYGRTGHVVEQSGHVVRVKFAATDEEAAKINKERSENPIPAFRDKRLVLWVVYEYFTLDVADNDTVAR